MTKIVHYIGNIIKKNIKIFIFRDKFLLSARRWFKDKGDETLRLNYNLNSDSIVFDIGGFEGSFSNDIYERYKAKIYIFEPVLSFYNSIKTRFKDNKSINIYNFGLSNINQEINISVDGDASSVHAGLGKTEKIELKSIIDFLEENNIKKIDLIKINIEGGEFDLLPALIENKIINQIENLQIQFHTFVDKSSSKRDKIRQELSKTHKLTYDYYFIWENWTLKK